MEELGGRGVASKSDGRPKRETWHMRWLKVYGLHLNTYGNA
jgi:hypothetical protein